MDDTCLDVIIIGGGQAGLVTSYFLKKLKIKHLVLEKGRIGESWRSQRWDSFTLSTPNMLNVLPGIKEVGKYPDGFCTRDELVKSYEKFSSKFDLPVFSDCPVSLVEKSQNSDNFVVHFTQNSTQQKIRALSVVLATGIMHNPKIPQLSKKIPNEIQQFHAGNYTNPSAIAKGAIIVVGGGRSGCQIVEDLQNAERRVYLCTSKVGRIPRRYRGKDIDQWFIETGYLDEIVDEIKDKNIISENHPQISGVGRHGHTVSLQKLEKEGVTLLGRLENIENDNLILKDNLEENIRYADKKSEEVKKTIDRFITQNEISTKKSEVDPADIPWTKKNPISPKSLNLKDAGVSAIIWCTGFKPDFSWINLPILDDSGFPVHKRGVSLVTGIYFVGFPWLYKRKSELIYGVKEDAEFISKKISAQIKKIK